MMVVERYMLPINFLCGIYPPELPQERGLTIERLPFLDRVSLDTLCWSNKGDSTSYVCSKNL